MENIQIPDHTSKMIVFDDHEKTSDISIQAGNGCSLTVFHWITGGSKIKVNLDISGRYSEVIYIGLLVGAGKETTKVDTSQKHLVKNSTSSVMLKSVLEDQAQLIFSGKIFVEKQATGTDAYQRNDNLLTGRDCQVFSRPILEILAGDLRCTHGVTIGHINPAELWYLKNRGIAPDRAVELISAGFLGHAIEKYRRNRKVSQIYRKIETEFNVQI